MNRRKHTPGPWYRNVPPARQYPTVFAGRNTHIAALRPDSRISDEEAEANLNLIAAAPLLLAACEQAETVLDAIEKACKANGDADAPGVTFCGLYDAHTDLRNAIAAARGEVQP